MIEKEARKCVCGERERCEREREREIEFVHLINDDCKPESIE